MYGVVINLMKNFSCAVEVSTWKIKFIVQLEKIFSNMRNGIKSEGSLKRKCLYLHFPHT